MRTRPNIFPDHILIDYIWINVKHESTNFTYLVRSLHAFSWKWTTYLAGAGGFANSESVPPLEFFFSFPVGNVNGRNRTSQTFSSNQMHKTKDFNGVPVCAGFRFVSSFFSFSISSFCWLMASCCLKKSHTLIFETLSIRWDEKGCESSSYINRFIKFERFPTDKLKTEDNLTIRIHVKEYIDDFPDV